MSAPVKIAYLEISPRQTGKTTRLCAMAKEILAQGKPVIFVCLPPYVPHIAKQLPGAVVLADGDPVPSGVPIKDAVWFYDEFDWLKSTVIREGGYYATTAARLRALDDSRSESDLLLQLVQANGHRHERYLWSFSMGQHRQAMPADHFRMSMLGEFLS